MRDEYVPMAAVLMDKVPEGDCFDMKEDLDFVEVPLASVASLFPYFTLFLFITHVQEPFKDCNGIW